MEIDEVTGVVVGLTTGLHCLHDTFLQDIRDCYCLCRIFLKVFNEHEHAVLQMYISLNKILRFRLITSQENNR